MKQMTLEKEKVHPMPKSMRFYTWPQLRAGFCMIGLIFFLAACGEPSVAASQAKATSRATTPQATATALSTPDAQVTPAFINDGAGPASRAAPQFAYDKQHKTLVLFGGRSFNGYLRDTWTWDGHIWTQQHPALSPGPILGASMAYDDATGFIVLFGGVPIFGPATNDTWLWNGTTWIRQHPSIAPPRRRHANMVYDAVLGQLVLFGGYGTDTKSPLNDTWLWNGTSWTQQHPATSPSARLSASMAYDAITHTVVLFGGDDMGAPIPLLTDTWTWNGTSWTQQHPATSPEVRFTSDNTLYGAYPTQTSMVLDEAAQKVSLTLAGS